MPGGMRRVAGGISLRGARRVSASAGAQAAWPQLLQGFTHLRAGETDAGLRALQESADTALFAGQGTSVISVYAHAAIGSVRLHRLGDTRAARDALGYALEKAEELGSQGLGDDAFVELVGIMNDLAVAELKSGAADQAHTRLRRAMWYS